MPAKNEERWCMAHLAHGLVQSAPTLEVRWKDGDDPPDFWLFLNGERVAVEHSSIQRCDHNIDSMAFQRLIEETGEEATRAGEVRGDYIVHLRGTIPNLGRIKAQIKNAIRKHVRTSESLESHQPQSLSFQSQASLSIQKIKGTGSSITWGWSPDPAASWPPEVRAELIALLKERLSAKAKRARVLGGRTILLLQDVHSAATKGLWVECLNQIPEQGAFWKIFVIDSYGHGFWACS